MAARYKAAVLRSATVVPFDENAASHYAQVRASTNVRGPDAIQLACAAAHGIELFVTNDNRLHKARVANVHFIVPIAPAVQLPKKTGDAHARRPFVLSEEFYSAACSTNPGCTACGA